jgi:hypothetical protein
MPRVSQELDAPSQPDEDPLFCLLEDDSLIFEFSVETDRLLIPAEPQEPERDVFAVINVTVMNQLGQPMGSFINQSFW